MRRMTYELGQGTGPLKGVKVVEIAGIGPGPHACTLLADLGADVIRVERPGGNPLGGGAHDLLTRGRPSVALDLKKPEAVAAVLDLVAGADVLVEGMRPGRHRAARPRPRGLLGAQPRAGLRPDDRVGPGRAAGRGRGPRHELRRRRRRPARPRPGPGAAALPDQPARRLRRRLGLPGDRGAGRAARGEGLRAGAGGGRRDRRRHRPPQPDGCEPAGDGRARRPAGRLDARRWCPVLRRLRDLRRQAPLGRRAGAPVLRRAPAPARPGGPARPQRPGQPGGHPRGVHRALRRAHPGRVGRALRRHRRLRLPDRADARRPPGTRTWPLGARTSSPTACSSPHPRRGSRGPRRRCGARPRPSVPAPATR